MSTATIDRDYHEDKSETVVTPVPETDPIPGSADSNATKDQGAADDGNNDGKDNTNKG